MLELCDPHGCRALSQAIHSARSTLQLARYFDSPIGQQREALHSALGAVRHPREQRTMSADHAPGDRPRGHELLATREIAGDHGIAAAIKASERRRPARDIELFHQTITDDHAAAAVAGIIHFGALFERDMRLGASRRSRRCRSQFSTASSTHPTRQGPRFTRLGNCPAFSSRALC